MLPAKVNIVSNLDGKKAHQLAIQFSSSKMSREQWRTALLELNTEALSSQLVQGLLKNLPVAEEVRSRLLALACLLGVAVLRLGAVNHLHHTSSPFYACSTSTYCDALACLSPLTPCPIAGGRHGPGSHQP